MVWRISRSAVVTLVFAAALFVATGGVASAAGGMTGEVFSGVPLFTGVIPVTHGTCSTPTVSHIAYQLINQPATGPAPGVYREFGSITITNGVVTDWTASWEVAAAPPNEPYVRGTKTLQSGGPGSVSCFPGLQSTGSAKAILNFVSSGAIVDSGTATGAISFDTAAMTGSFSEIFGPLQPTSKDDCKNGGFANFNFVNQGQCIEFVHDLTE